MFLKVEALVLKFKEIDEEEEEYDEDEDFEDYEIREVFLNPNMIESAEGYNVNGDHTLVIMQTGYEYEVMLPVKEFMDAAYAAKKEDIFTRFYKDKGN